MTEETEKKIIELPAAIIIKDFAVRLDLPVGQVMAELMKNGIMSPQNELIDYETASIIAEDLGYKTKRLEEKGEKMIFDTLIEDEDKSKFKSRPPVVVVMGHVDHGKTKLLDAIRQTNVVAQESGGITQHIGAYQAAEKGRKITFIDTPGHEAFSAMRSRGAKVADLAILVVAADDGIQPQTKEAIEIIQKNKLPFIVAINKIDKPEANPEKIKKQLAEMDLLPEDWGGKTTCVNVSAEKKQGIKEILEMILLVADLEKENIKANPLGKLMGSVVESHVDKGEGPVATILILNGTLKIGDLVQVGEVFGKIKTLKDYLGRPLKKAEPSMPVRVLGLKAAPLIGDILLAASDFKQLKKKSRDYVDRYFKTAAPTRRIDKKKIEAEPESEKAPIIKKINIVLRADTLGSLQAIGDALKKIKHEEAEVEVVFQGLGSITEADVLRAETAKALLLGFHVKITPGAEVVAKGHDQTINLYQVIYDLLDDVKAKLEGLLSLEVIITELGRIKILAIFQKKPKSMIVGGKITKGKITTGGKVQILRDKELVGQGKITELQCNKQKVTEVSLGQECGLQFEGPPVIEVNDTLISYQEETKKKKIR